jgi:hypothetical protein
MLKPELNRKDRAIVETAALFVLQKSPRYLRERRGRLAVIEQSVRLISLVTDALKSRAWQSKVCVILGISARTL